MTRSDLLNTIYRFYPRGMLGYDPAYDGTVEHRRLVDAHRCARAAFPQWKRMIERLGARYPMTPELFTEHEPAYSGRAHLPSDDRSLGFHVSVIGPYYAIHRMGWPDEEPFAEAIERDIRATYPGHDPIPPELGNEVVPDVAGPVPFGEATIYVCLLSFCWLFGSGWVGPQLAKGDESSPGDSDEIVVARLLSSGPQRNP